MPIAQPAPRPVLCAYSHLARAAHPEHVASTTPQPKALHLGLGAAGAQMGNTALCPRSCPRNLGITACPVSAVTLLMNERRHQAVYFADPVGSSPVGPGFLLDAD